MILNNGRQEVDTAHAILIGLSETKYRPGGSLDRVEYWFKAYQSTRTRKYFIVGTYQEFSLSPLLNLPTRYILDGVWEDEAAFARALEKYGIVSPKREIMMEVV